MTGYFNLEAKAEFLAAEHTDPVDRLVVRLIDLTSSALDVYYRILGDDQARNDMLHTALFADVCMCEVQKVRNYPFVPTVNIGVFFYGALMVEDAFSVKHGLSVVDNIDYFNSTIDICEKQVVEVKKRMAANSDTALYGSISWGNLDDDSVVRHEVLPNHYVLPDSLGIGHENFADYFGLAHQPLAGRDEDTENALDLVSLGHLSTEGATDYKTYWAKTRRAYLEKLMAPQIEDSPELKSNELFWSLVEQCELTISAAIAAGRGLDVVTSSSGFSGSRQSVTLLIGASRLAVALSDDEADEGKFYVMQQGFRNRSIKTDAELLAFVTPFLG